MGRKSQTNDYHQEISDLKDAVGELNKNIAVMAEAMKSLKEFMERDSSAHADMRRALELRLTALETKMDSLELEKAKDSYIKERLVKLETSSQELDKTTKDLQQVNQQKDGWSSGAKWAFGCCAVVGLPSFGFVIEQAIKHLFG